MFPEEIKKCCRISLPCLPDTKKKVLPQKIEKQDSSERATFFFFFEEEEKQNTLLGYKWEDTEK